MTNPYEILPPDLLDHLEELRLTFPSASLFIFLLEQNSIKNSQLNISKSSKARSTLQMANQKTITNPLDALLEEAGNLALPNRVHKLTSCMMR